MAKLNNHLTAALDKLSKAQQKNIKGQKEKVMAPFVAQALEDFCRQDTEFAQAVAQGGSFADCMAAVAKGVGSSISDLDAYKNAVSFYFPGAKIQMQMRIDLIGDAAAPAPEPKAPEAPAFTLYKPEPNSLVLSLDDFL